MIVEVDFIRSTTAHTRLVSVPDDAVAWQISCLECSGTGWWDYARYADPGGICIECKGTGRVWFSLR